MSVSSLAIISCSFNSIAQAVSPNAIELTYFASQIQCGAGSSLINVQVDVYRNQQFVNTLSLNDSLYLPINSFDELTFQYNFTNAECSPTTPTEMVLAPEDTVPNLPGAYDQDSIQQMLDGLNEYEELFLVELGTTNPDSSAYDLQDVVMIINNNPTPVKTD
ncbi:MAG: hypothetical protein QNJ55_11355 [Xenococcus sp. MO_188.B8]|nr:hypothetical protein [Xenococcus sp. MO_188.B8]